MDPTTGINITALVNAKNATLFVMSPGTGLGPMRSTSGVLAHHLSWQTLGLPVDLDTESSYPQLLTRNYSGDTMVELGVTRIEVPGYNGNGAVRATPSSGTTSTPVASIASVSVDWAMPDNYLPGVLAPYSDVEQREPAIDLGSYHQ